MKFEPQSDNGKDISYSSVRPKGSGRNTICFGKSHDLILLCKRRKRSFVTNWIFFICFQSQRFPASLFRVQHAIEVCLHKRYAKELVVALELSDNHGLLADACSWTEKNQDDIQVDFLCVAGLWLIAFRVSVAMLNYFSGEYPSSRICWLGPQKRKEAESEIIPGEAVTPRYREIGWKAEEK